MNRSTHTFLREAKDQILREWERSVQAEAPLVDLKDALLRDHVPEFLDELANWMERNEPPGTYRMRTAAIDHAAQRLQHGFQLTQFLHEVRLLRSTILRLLLGVESAQQRGGTTGMPARVEELARLNTGLDFAMADAAEHFVAGYTAAELATREIALARESDERKTEFLAVLSHELRNPLAPILNSLHILERAESGSAPSVRAKEVIRRQMAHLTRLIDDLLDLTRITHGRVHLRRERFDLRDVVRATCDDERSLVEERGLSLRLEVAAGPVWIEGDRTRIAQVLSNLIQNGAKFTPAGGTLSVTISVDGKRAALHVRDDGIGMDPVMIERAFEPFVQRPQDSARQQGGLGLGLAVVKGLVDLHGGSVSVRSDGVDCGSEFVVELPLAPPPLEEPVRTRAQSPSRLVLIIEDNVDNGDSLAEMLELSGHRTHIARNGKSGIALAQDLKPDVVFCDIGLPDVDGYEVARTLREDARLATTRLVALSGYAQPEDKKRASEAGFDAHLAKPPAFNDLNEILVNSGPERT